MTYIIINRIVIVRMATVLVVSLTKIDVRRLAILNTILFI